MQKLLEVSIVARRLNCSCSTIIRMIEDPDNPLKGVRLTSRTIRVIEDTIEDVLRNNLVDNE
jgi:hypothetical protein